MTNHLFDALLAGRLARFKQPKRVLFVDELPRNVTGKVRENILRDDNAALFTKTGHALAGC